MTGWRELVDGGPTWPLRRQSGRELELLLEDGRLRQDPRQSSVTRHDEPPPAAAGIPPRSLPLPHVTAFQFIPFIFGLLDAVVTVAIIIFPISCFVLAILW